MNGASFKQGFKQGGIGAAFGLGMGAVGGAAGGWISTTPAGQKVGSWMGKHSKGQFFDRKNPNSPFSPIGKNTNVYVEDYTIEMLAYDDGVHQVPAQTYTVDVPEPDLGGMNVWPAAKTSTNLFGKEVASTATRMGRDGRAVEVLF